MKIKNAQLFLKEDLPKILSHLEITGDVNIVFDNETEGFCWIDQRKIRIGLKKIDSREWLRIWIIHELLHLKGMQHYSPPEYESTVTYDAFSKKIYNMIFVGNR